MSVEMEVIPDEVNLQEEFNSAVINADLKTIAELSDQVEINVTNQQGVTPLFTAIENGNVELAQILLRCGADVNGASYCQTEGAFEIPLATAVRGKRKEMVELLFEHGCQVEDVAQAGKSPIHWAAMYGDIDVAQILLQRGANVDHLGPYLHSALHYATIANQEEMVRWLLTRGAKLTENGDDRSALHIASIRGNTSIVVQLLDHGSPFDVRDRFNFLPFSLACLRGHLDVVKVFIEKTSGNVDLNDGLLRAAEAGHISVIEYLVEQGADVNTQNSNRESVLTVATARGHFNVALTMMNMGVKINVIDNRKYTPLLLSVMREHVDLVTALVMHCGDFSLSMELAESPSRMAFSLKHPMLIKLFLLSGFCVIGESWFTENNIEVELKELDYTTPASRRNVWETNMVKEAWSWLKDRVNQPLKLKEHCRIAVRRQLSKVTDGCSILGNVDFLPLPMKILEYLKFSELLIE